MFLKFPEKFYWGSATSSHQVEGDNRNDWSEWEKIKAVMSAEEARNRWEDWQKEKFPEMLSPKNYISGKSCDHYNRFREDFDIAKSLNHNAHRFSIEWSRIEPEEGKFNKKEIEHYREVIKALRERGMEPFVTLWHWTNPLWLAKMGESESKKFPYYFNRYAQFVIEQLGDLVNFWISINEPLIYKPLIYAKTHFAKVGLAPQEKNLFKTIKVMNNLIRAHKSVYDLVHKNNSRMKVGIVKHCIYFDGDLILSKLSDHFWNKYLLNKISNHQDFIGLNYYHRNRIRNFKFNQNENKEIADLGWEIYPEGIYHVLKGLRRYNVPIYITENGLADSDDLKREKFIKDHLYWIFKAIQDGIDVRGYLYWSLLDNFEWDKGFWPRFGLIEVDYKTMKRKIRKSAEVYAKICKDNELEV